MYKTIAFYLLCMLFFSSCTQSLDSIPSNKEIVQGFAIVWRKNVTEDKKTVIREILNDMQYVQGGIFLMGATQEQEPFATENERPAHYVQVADYYICKHEISIKQVEVLTGTELSVYEKNNGAPRYTWKDWQHILNLIKDYADITMDFPTEAQWEYAARGGNMGKGSIYSGGNTIKEAESSANELGLFDMARCHSEWCKDAYNNYSDIPLDIDPYYIQGLGHVVRGGNAKSTEETKDYFKSTSNGNKFSSSYKDIRSCRVSARSYCEDRQSYLGIYISCRFVINLNK